MNIYKVTMEKVVFVRAENSKEAEKFAIDEYAIMIEESVIGVEKSTKRDMLASLFDDIKKEGTNNEEA